MESLIKIIRGTNTNIYPNVDLNNRIVFGIRGTDADIKIGDVLPASYDSVDNNMVDEIEYKQLSGTCACKLIEAFALSDIDDNELTEMLNKTINKASKYGKNVALVYGIDTGEIANDDFNNEIIIDDCTVAAII